MEMSNIFSSEKVYNLFEDKLFSQESLNVVNNEIYSICGIKDFFLCKEDFIKVKNNLKSNGNVLKDDNRIEYGDFQTPEPLAELVISRVLKEIPQPTIVLEPTCGKGNFILPLIKQSNGFLRIFCIEIYKPYIWESKFKILDYFLESEHKPIPEITFVHESIFKTNLQSLIKAKEEDYLLILGNPPWVTNSQLGVLNSDNLPLKSNFKGLNGMDALTGKGNFDIAEYISLLLFRSFSKIKGAFALLLKNSVIKNLLSDQKENNYRIGNLSQYSIDAKKEFGVSVEASLLCCILNSEPEYLCRRRTIYTSDSQTDNVFGYVENKFVADISTYEKFRNYDGKSVLEWRQGVKHDCAKVMELEKENGYYINQNKEEIDLENDLIYAFLKSSDLNKEIIESTRKYTIITQRKIGDDTSYIERYYPKTFQYLEKNKEYFNLRKSQIYKGKPLFSIFGIGDYAFFQFKVGISGLYKQTKFSLILPAQDKPVMLDDTCYFLGFDNPLDSVIVLLALNHFSVQEFLSSIIFYDSKRVITKDVLMRIDIGKVMKSIPVEYYIESIEKRFSNICGLITSDNLERRIEGLTYSGAEKMQMELFGRI